jgi:protein-disulfide isomerase
LVQIHPNAGNASLVAACAGAQGKFWQMHDLLFARQTEWAPLK